MMPAMLLEPAGGKTLAPHQLWARLLIERGFLSSPGGTKDRYRSRPARRGRNIEDATSQSPDAGRPNDRRRRYSRLSVLHE